MTQRKKHFYTAAMILVLSGCAHGPQRGNVAMKISDTEAHIHMENSRVGKRVTVFENDCQVLGDPREGAAKKNCNKVQIGHGVITEILNDEYSIVQFDSALSYKEGAIVEVR